MNIFKLKAIYFLVVLSVVLIAILIFAPSNTLAAGIATFAVMSTVAVLAVNHYNKTPKE
jgi:hypothetical protein